MTDNDNISGQLPAGFSNDNQSLFEISASIISADSVQLIRETHQVINASDRNILNINNHSQQIPTPARRTLSPIARIPSPFVQTLTPFSQTQT
ncbi:hypothetical protein PV325_008530 [Microctonus aethiopoides]|nr:hypothetical protein PV325_008530 [Microctonus aethiopoides]